MSNITERTERIVAEFSRLEGWEDRYRRLIAMGQALGDLPDAMKDEDHKVRGCQSQVWLRASLDIDRISFRGDSDALIVKGLVSILIEAYSGATPSEILATPPVFLQRIGLDQHLSPSRSNGLHSMVKQIMFYATAYQTLLHQPVPPA